MVARATLDMEEPHLGQVMQINLTLVKDYRTTWNMLFLIEQWTQEAKLRHILINTSSTDSFAYPPFYAAIEGKLVFNVEVPRTFKIY